MSQEQLDTLLANRVQQAQRSASTALLTELGFANKADAQTWVNQQREAAKAQMTEAERVRAEAEEKAQQATALQAQASESIRNLAVERALITTGADLAKAGQMVAMVKVEPDADAAAITAAVEAFKTEWPALFGTPGKPPPSSEPANGGPPGSRSQGSTPAERGAERAKAYKVAHSLGAKTP